MQNHAMSNRKAFSLIRPKSSKDRRSLRDLVIYALVIFFAVAGFFYLQRRAQERRAQDWISATATIEDARPKLVSHGNSQGGGAMLYQVEILARYSQGNVSKESWIAVAQYPTLRADAEMKVTRWKGHLCIVRWRASDPSKVVAEAS